MQDVARVAGVSHQTVSRVLNGHPRVRPETRERVLGVIADLGYRRNSAARALVTSRSGTIGLLTPRSVLYGPVSTLISVEEAARSSGLFVSVASLGGFHEAAVTAALDHFMDQGVEGIIVIAPVAEAVRVASELASQVPMVLIAADTASGAGFRVASVDQELGARLATRHLIDLGHTDIAHVSGPPLWLDARARRRGWERELGAAGLTARVPVDGGWTAQGGYLAGQRLIDQGPPTAVFAANDLMALGLVRALTEAGLTVPHDVSVVGFDDIEGASHYLPPLTTVRQDFSALGQRSVELLREQLSVDGAAPVEAAGELVQGHNSSSGAHSAGRPARSASVMAPQLVVRSSATAPVRRSSRSR